MDDLLHLWRLSWVAELGRHLAAVLSPHLPAGRELVATGRAVALLVRPGDGPPRVASTYELPVPTQEAVLDAQAVAVVLADLQADVATHLGRAWPVTDEGVALTAQTRDAEGDVVELGFVAAGTTKDALVLPPFVAPGPLADARSAG